MNFDEELLSELDRPVPKTVHWRPPGARHVEASYEVQGPGAERLREVTMHCTRCGARAREVCAQNAPRTRIARFASRHLNCKA